MSNQIQKQSESHIHANADLETVQDQVDNTSALLNDKSAKMTEDHEQQQQIQNQKSKSNKWGLGICCLVAVSIIWTASSVVKKWIFNEDQFNQPFFVTVVWNSCYLIQFITHGLQKLWRRYYSGSRRSKQRINWRNRSQSESQGQEWTNGNHGRVRDDNSTSAQPETSQQLLLEQPQDQSQSQASDQQWNKKQTTQTPPHIAALIISPVWFLGQWTYGIGLAATSITSSTVICTTSCVSVFILSITVLKEHPTWLKWAGVGLCMLGNVCLGFNGLALSASVSSSWSGTETQGMLNPQNQEQDSHQKQNQNINIFSVDTSKEQNGDTFVGDFICWLSTVFYAVYCVLIRRYVKDPVIFFAYVGFYVALIGFPLTYLILPHSVLAQGFEPKMFSLLLVTGLLDNVLSQYFWAYGVLLTSPTVATVGLSMTIPLAIVSDLFKGVAVGWLQYVAAVLVTGGFILMSVFGGDGVEDDDEDRDDIITGQGRQLQRNVGDLDQERNVGNADHGHGEAADAVDVHENFNLIDGNVNEYNREANTSWHSNFDSSSSAKNRKASENQIHNPTLSTQQYQSQHQKEINQGLQSGKFQQLQDQSLQQNRNTQGANSNKMQMANQTQGQNTTPSPSKQRIGDGIRVEQQSTGFCKDLKQPFIEKEKPS